MPRIIIYYVGKDDLLIYGQEIYSESMEKISAIHFSKIIKDMPLSDDLFVLPKDTKILTPKDEKDLQQVLIESML